MLDILTKLLAQENITLQRGNYRTASFDLVNRVVHIPNLVGMTNTEELLMIFHEVGHALFTDVSYLDEVKSQRSNKRNFGDYMNVIEDVRIERKIKDMYPGSRRDFYQGYRSLNERDFFGIANRDLTKLSLIDRINLYYKSGSTCGVRFNEQEMVFVNRAESTNTIDDVILLANDVYAYAAAQKVEQEENISENDLFSFEEEEYEDEFSDYAEEQEEQEEYLEEKNDVEERTSKGAGGDEINEEEAPESVTQNAFDKSISKMSSTEDTIFVNPVLSSYYATVDFGCYSKNQSGYKDVYLPELDGTKLAIKRAASYMFREFNMKKAAARYARQTQSKSGSLNMGKLYQYKTSDDLFRKYNVVVDDKNHGMVVVLDFSGSMASTIKSAFLEVYTLCTFCNMAKIPFKVFMFAGASLPGSLVGKKGATEYNRKQQFGYHGAHVAGSENTIHGQPFCLVEIASSTHSFRDVEKSLMRSFMGDTIFGMTNTPLTETYLLMLDIIPKFRRDNQLQKVSLVTITDGGGGVSKFIDSTGKVDELAKAFIEDKETGKKYQTGRFAYTNAMKILRDRYSYLSVVGFFIIPRNSVSHLSCFVGAYLDDDFHNSTQRNAKMADIWRTMKDNVIRTSVPGYDSMMIFVGNSIREEFDLGKISSTSTAAAAAREFSKGMRAGIKNKVVLSNLVDHIS